MKKILIPQQDVNSPHATIREWLVTNKEEVKTQQAILTVETSKALYEVYAECNGTLVHTASVGEQLDFQTVVGYIFEEGETIDLNAIRVEQKKDDSQVKITAKAKRLAEELGVDISAISVDGIIKEKDVREHAAGTGTSNKSIVSKRRTPSPFSPFEYPQGVKRILALGAGNCLAQVQAIAARTPHTRIVGCLDDNNELHGRKPFGIDCLGASHDVEKLWKEGVFDQAIIAINTVKIRAKLFDFLKTLGVPLANVVDPSAQLNPFVSLGEGNIICAQVHIGAYTEIGDNNMISAMCSIEHHNKWGSHSCLGPCCCFSGSISVGDNVRFGTGIFAEPRIEIGSDTIIASGAILTTSVPDKHIVKTQVTQVVSKL